MSSRSAPAPLPRPAAIRLHCTGPLEAVVVAALQRACFPEDPWDDASVATLTAPPAGFAVIALDGQEQPVGFAMARVAVEDAEILAIGVLPQARRSGIGRQLVEAVAAGCNRRGATALFLEVAEDNQEAWSLYKACGFFSVGRRPGYYRRPDGRVAALVLRRNLDGA